MTVPATTPFPRSTPAWKTVFFALLAFAVLPVLPTALRVVLPITQTIGMVAALLAVCGILGWWNGGSGLFASVWFAVAAWMLVPSWFVAAGSGYTVLTQGWMLLLAAAFGIASLVTPRQAFFTRALSAVGIATVAAFALVIMVPDGLANVRGVMTTEYTRRAEQMIADFDHEVKSPEWRQMTKEHPTLDSLTTRLTDQSEIQLRSLPGQSVTVMPALIALESLAALALAWVVYHRMSSTPLGPPLGLWREFRFNDQLIWGLAVGATVFFLPPFVDGKNAGLNLLLFFGTLYLLRGIGVLSWATRGRGGGTAAVLIIVTAIAPQLIAALALGVGVGDTWMDWRSRVSSAT